MPGNIDCLNSESVVVSPNTDTTYKLIANNDQLFTTEKHFLNYIGKQKITEEYINKLTEKHSN